MWEEGTEDAWNGLDFLSQIDGPTSRFPAFRVLFLVARLNAGGLIKLVEGEQSISLGVARGKLVLVEGVPGLLRGLDPKLPDHRQLNQDLGIAMTAGHSYEKSLSVALDALGVWLASQLEGTEGQIQFVPAWSPPPKTFPLPTPISRILASGLRAARDEGTLRRFWNPRLESSLQPTPPQDSSEERWGLDATALRMLNLSGRAKTPGILVDLVTGSEPARRGEALRALDLLYWLGIIRVGAPVQATETPRITSTAPRSSVAERLARELTPPSGPEVERFEQALKRFASAHPVEILELTAKRRLNPEEVATAYRDISKRYHPDLFPQVRALAERCFEAIHAAYETLLSPNGMVDANRFLEAKANGIAYVNEKDHTAARVACKKGELALRNREWSAAATHLEEAWRLDSGTWPHAFLRLQARYFAKLAPFSEVLKELETLATQLDPGPRDPNRPADQPLPPATVQRYSRRAEVLFVMGTFSKQENKQEDAVAFFRKAVEADPENRDALRELRLVEKRAAVAAEEGWLGKLLTRR